MRPALPAAKRLVRRLHVFLVDTLNQFTHLAFHSLTFEAFLNRVFLVTNVSILTVALLVGCGKTGGGEKASGAAQQIADGTLGSGGAKVAGDGYQFTGGDDRDLVVAAITKAAAALMDEYETDPTVAESMCMTQTLGHEVGTLVRGLEYEARRSCRLFFETYHVRLAELFHDPAKLRVTFTSDALTVKDRRGMSVSVHAMTPTTAGGTILVDDDPQLLSDKYAFAMLLLHEYLHRFAFFDDFEAGPEGFDDEDTGNRSYLNALAASIVIGAYDRGIWARYLSTPNILLSFPEEFDPLRNYTRKVGQLLAGDAVTEEVVERLISVRKTRSEIVKALIASKAHRGLSVRNALNELLPDLSPEERRRVVEYQENQPIPPEQSGDEFIRMKIVTSALYAGSVQDTRAWVTKLHRDVRGVIDPNVVDFHVRALNSGQNARRTLAAQVFDSNRLTYMKAFYRRHLRRDPTANELALLPVTPLAGAGSHAHRVFAGDEYALFILVGK